jgi:hypothetical protein
MKKKCVDSNPGRQPICYAVNAIYKWRARSVVVFALALAIATSFSPASAGQSRVSIKHAPIQVIRDPKGNALRTREGQFASSNWSGYVLPNFQTGVTYTSAQGTWVVPTVVGNKKLAVSSNWVGIGGFCKNAKCSSGDRTLIQLGTAQAAKKSQTQYFAWYEMLPAGSVMTQLVVNPGDVITASLSCNPCTGNQSWMLSMTNVTTGEPWNLTVPYQASKLSVEWIEEAPTGGHGIFPLANYGTSTFDSSMINGGSADLATGDSIVMFDPHHQSSNVSAVDATADGFSACFGPKKKLVSCSFVAIP